MQREAPVFSVIIPTFNRPAMLKRAIESVARQEFPHFEVIVSDDGSTSDLKEIIRSFSHIPMKLLLSPTNKGAATARNRGISEAEGRYVAFLDDDDEYLPDFLSATYETLQRSAEDVAYCWSNIWNVRYSGKEVSSCEATDFKFPAGATSMPFEDALRIGVGYGVTVRRDMLLEVGCFDAKLKTVEDTDLFIKLLRARALPTLVQDAKLRVHHHAGDRMTASPLNAVRIRECWLLMEKHAPFFSAFPLLEQQLMRQVRYLQQVAAAGLGARPAESA